MPFEDKNLICKDCGRTFVWTAGEQEFFQQKGLLNPPARCPEDRQKRKKERTAGDLVGQKMYSVVCSNCGDKDEVPFEIKDPSSILCADCFKLLKEGKLPEKVTT